jgi:PAS domain S-box-containing protein
MLNKFTVSVKLYLLIFITAISLIGLGLYGITDLEKMNRNTQTLYADRVLPYRELSNVRFAYNTNITPIAQKVKNRVLTFNQAKTRVQKAQAVIDSNWYKYKLTYLTEQEAHLVNQVDAIKRGTDEASRQLLVILARGDMQALDTLIQKNFSADPAPFSLKLSQLMDLQIKIGKEIFDSNNRLYHNTTKKFLLLIFFSLVIALSLSFYIIKNIKNLIKDILTGNNTIKESEEKYQSLFEQASDAIYVVNHKGSFTNVNNSMCQMTGYTRDELLVMNLNDLVNAELQKINPLCHTILKPGETITGERKFIHKNGNIVDIEINGKKMTDDRMLVILRDITLRKKMEAELRKAELRFRTLADKSMVGIYIVQKGAFTYVNPRFAEVFGYEAHELIGREPVEAIIHDKYQAVSNENIRKRVEGEAESVHYEAMGKRKDGSSNWVEFYGSGVIFDDEPTIIGSMIDITERKMAENELRESEQKYKMLFDSSPMPLLMVAKNDMSIIAANREATYLYGYTNEELLNMTIKDLRHVEDQALVWDNFKVDLPAPTDRGIFRHVKKNGEEIKVQVIAHDIVFEGKEVRLGLYNDLTEKIKAQEIHEKTEANLQTILNNTDTAYALLDSNLHVLEYNNKALIFARAEFNFNPENGSKLFDHLPESRRARFFEYIDDVFKGKTISYEVIYDQSGDNIWYYVRMFPISNKEDEIIGMVLAITDITERKDAEQRLQQAYERTKEHIQIIREMAWKQSHILRSPLANLKGLITILQKDPGDAEVMNFMETELERMDSVFTEMAEDSSKDEIDY